MNKKQKMTVLAAVAAIAAMCVFVPFKRPAGMEPYYDFIWNMNAKIGSFKIGSFPVDYERLALQIAIVLVVALVGFIIFKKK